MFEGVVTGGTSIGSVSLLFGTPQDYPSGALTRVYITVSSLHTNRLMEGLLLSVFDQDGTMKAGAVDNAAALASNVVTTAKILDSNVTTAKLADGAVTAAKVDNAIPVQIVSTGFSAVATGTTQMVQDDTIPQNTEGVEYMTQAITPKSATNILVIEVTAMLTCTDIRTIVGALYQDSTADALAVDSMRIDTATAPYTLKVSHRMVAGTTSATTFKFRAGQVGAGTTTFNGSAGARLFGATTKSSIVITEYKAS